MKITITGSLGNIGKPLTQKLVAAGHDVTVISSNEQRQTDIEDLGATAAIGSVHDAGFLAAAFADADSVFLLTPPNLGGANIVANTAKAGEAFAQAVKASGVKRVVVLSSIGADHATGNGPIAGLYQVESALGKLEGISVTFLRAGYFYTNSYAETGLIKQAGIMGGNYPGSTRVPFVHPKDIAAVAAEELQVAPAGQHVRYVVSDVVAADEYVKTLGAAIGKPDLARIEFTDEQSLQGMIAAGLPEEIAGLYTEMGSGFRKGILQADFEKQGSPVIGNTKAGDFAKEFAIVFAN